MAKKLIIMNGRGFDGIGHIYLGASSISDAGRLLNFVDSRKSVRGWMHEVKRNWSNGCGVFTNDIIPHRGIWSSKNETDALVLIYKPEPERQPFTKEQQKLRVKESKLRRDLSSPPRTCIVCGKLFRRRGRNAQVHCSRSCSTYTKLAFYQNYQPPEVRKKQTESRLKHPKFSLSEKHFRARYWSFLSPEGKSFQCINASHFVRTHKKLFLEKDILGCDTGSCLAAKQLTRLRPGKHQISSWKSWTWLFLDPLNSQLGAGDKTSLNINNVSIRRKNDQTLQDSQSNVLSQTILSQQASQS